MANDLLDLLLFLLVGLVAGWIAAKLMRGGGLGVLGNLVVGVIGAFIGGHVLRFLHVSIGGVIGELVTATVGAIVLLLVVGVLKRA